MVKLLKYFKVPVFNSVLICLFIFYSGVFKIPEHYKYVSLCNKTYINSIEGQILSSPVKITNGKYYKAIFKLHKTNSQSNFKSSANGRINIYIPTEKVEAFFPGKIYSSSKNNNNAIFEIGGFYTLTGNFHNSDFYVNECTEYYWKNNITGRIDLFRSLCRLQFKRLLYSWGEAGGFLLALLCGAKEYTNINISENFKNAGLSHILALSGMHLSMFSSIAIFFGKKIKRKKLSFILRIVFSFLFVWFAGISPSLLRAYICAMLSLIASMAGTEEPDMILILCFSFLLQSIISPSDLFNVGFILSYCALAGILIFNKFFYNLYTKIIPKYISASLASSTSAQIFTLPISLKLFGSFAPIGIIATTVISPLVTLFIYTGLFFIIICLIFPGLVSYSAIIINILYNIIKYIVNIFAKVPKWSVI